MHKSKRMLPEASEEDKEDMGHNGCLKLIADRQLSREDFVRPEKRIGAEVEAGIDDALAGSLSAWEIQTCNCEHCILQHVPECEFIKSFAEIPQARND